MSLRAIIYAYLLGGVTFLPLLICAAIAWTIYTSEPVNNAEAAPVEKINDAEDEELDKHPLENLNDLSKPRKAWLTVRRTFEEKEAEGSYVNMMRSFLDARSKDPKRSRPKDMWYVVLKGNVLYLYEDESMTECEAAIQISSYDVVVYPEGLLDGELFARRNAICLKPNASLSSGEMPNVSKEMDLEDIDAEGKVAELNTSDRKKGKEKDKLVELGRLKAEARKEAFDFSAPWFIFIRSCVEMEDWYLSLVHAAKFPDQPSTLEPVRPVYDPSDMDFLVSTIDEQPDVIPMRWLNALIGRMFFSFYRTETLETFVIGRIMKKLSRIKTPSFLQNIAVTEVSLGNRAPTLSKPMLKELTKEGDTSLEIKLQYRGEIRLTMEATAIINLGQRFKTYTVKLVLAIILRKLDGNLLVKVKRPPTNRLWYAFTQPPDMTIDIEPVVSDRQLKWNMILSTIESRLREVINESVVLPNMDDIAFFESSKYSQRGGIWADARRKDRVVSDLLEKDNTSSDLNATVPKAHSTDEVIDSAPLAVPEPDNITRAETVAAPEAVDNSKRKSWFSSTRSASGGSMSGPGLNIPEDQDDPLEAMKERGRSPTIEPTTRRATSVPAPPTAISPQVNSPSVERLSTGTGPDLNDATQSSNSDDSPSETSTVLTSRLRSLSSGASSHTRDPSETSLNPRTPNSATSFLSALRAKDKQAISNTAKEAMKKWSANWNGFKQNHMGNSNGNANAASSDEALDEPPSSANGLSSNSIFSFPAKRNNFAEIRAAVASRKERERVTSFQGFSQSDPIDIPERTSANEESNAGPSSFKSSSPLSSSGDTTPSSPPLSQHSPRGPSLLRRDSFSHRSTPSPPKVTAAIHTDDTIQSQMTTGNAPSSISPPSPLIQAVPIKTQPSYGATMTIPGIHASHRNEVMSLGYSPPPPVHAPSTPESKVRTAPTIQSVYRLFKSPTATGNTLQLQQQQQQQQVSPSPSPQMSTGEITSIGERQNEDVVPMSLSSESSQQTLPLALVTPTPPPLPPRTGQAARIVSSSSTPIKASPTPPQEQNTSGLTSSASEVLKQIASLDENARKSLETEAKSSSTNERKSINVGRVLSLNMTEVLISKEDDIQNTVSDVSQTSELHPAASDANVVGHGDNTTFETQASSDLVTPQQDDNTRDLTPNQSRPVPPPLPPRRSSTVAQA